MRDFVFLLLIVVLFFSCSREKRVTDLITDGEYKYWLVSKGNNLNWELESFYYLDKNGKWLVFTKYLDKKIWFSKPFLIIILPLSTRIPPQESPFISAQIYFR